MNVQTPEKPKTPVTNEDLWGLLVDISRRLGALEKTRLTPVTNPVDIDATEYLYSDPANRKVMLERAADIETGKNLVSFPAEQFRL
ncbi:hypothetical protein FACS189447_09870 [Spirochaetia bacterium]|nr:hypothetical protein FACS189447_09870 [Spirochaetia bacterium]